MTNKQKKWLLSVGGVFLAYTLIGFFIAPWYIKSTLTDVVAEKTEATLSIERLYLNPFTFYTEANTISLQHADSGEMVAIDALQLNLDVTGLFKKVLVLSEFKLLQPMIDAVVDADGNINLVQALNVGDSESADETEPSDFNFLLAVADIVDGQVTVTDNSSEPQRQATIDEINLSLKNITSISQETGDYNFSLHLGGESNIKTGGDLTLNPLTVRGGFSVEKIGLDQVLTWVQEFVPVVSADGAFSASGDYSVALEDDSLSFKVDKLSADLETVSLQDTFTELTTSFDEFSIKDAAYDGTASVLTLGSSRLQGLAAKTSADEDYVTLGGLSLADVELNLNELEVAVGDTTIDKLSLLAAEAGSLAEFDTLSLQEMTYAKADGLLNVGSIELDKTAAQLPVDTEGKLDLPSLPLKTQANVPTETSEEEAAGPGALQRIQVGNTAITELGITTQSAEAGSVAENLLALGTFQVSELNLDLAGSALDIESVALKDTDVNLALDEEQQLNVVRLFANPDAEKEETKTTTEANSAAFAYTIGKVTIAGTRVELNNNSLANAVQHQLTNIDVSVEDISSASDQSATFTASATVGVADEGQLSLNGSVVPSVMSARADISIDSLDLTPFNPYLAETTSLKLDSGSLGFSATTELFADGAGMRLQDGELGINKLSVSDAANDVTLFSSENIAVNELGYETSPPRLTIGKVLTTKPYVNILIDEEGRLNLAQELKGGDGDASSSAAEAEAEPQSAPIQIEVSSIEIQEGSMDFSDQSLVPKFRTKVHELNGVANGLSSEKERFATLALTGNVNEFGSTTITGELQPFNIERQTEISMEFDNIDTSSLTPYTAKFAGRKIESGRLSLDLNYKVNLSKLDGNNNIVLQSLVLGERVESPDAMDLPLDMAISLLEDSDGKIDLDIPISGDLDNPKFDIGSVIQKAVGNLVTGIVTSPFQFLGSLLGGDTSDLNIIEYEPGSARIMPAEAEKLANLGTALESRPNLLLTVTGRYAPAVDTRALARQQLREQVAAISEQPEGTVNATDPATQDILDDLADDRVSEDVMDKLEADREQQEAAESEQAAMKSYYDALIERLVDSYAAVITETDLRGLATRRAGSAKEYLVETTPTVTDRITISDKVIGKEAETEAVTLELEIGTVK